MKTLHPYSSILQGIILLGLLISCVKSDDFDVPKENCNTALVASKTSQEIFDVSTSSATKYREEDLIEGYVVSSDQAGNFFKTLSIQSLDSSLGFNISIDQSDLYTLYNPGRKVWIQLQGLYTEIDNNSLKIGSLYIDNFNNETVGRIGYPSFEEVIIKSCELVDENMLVTNISLEDISDASLNTLIELTNVQFVDDVLENTFYDPLKDEGGSATNHKIQDTSGNTLIFRTSAFADFSNINVPEGNGTIRGILTKFKGEYQLLARTLNDVKLVNDRQQIIRKNNLFFSELADPNNNAGARFIEIYNAENVSVNLNGWTVRRYTNANTTISSTLDLSGNSINAGQAFVIAANAAEFEAVFGHPPDLEAGTNGPADSNGDDTIELVDSEGTVVDIFGIIGEDGTGTNHEFEDGRALRKMSVISGNTLYTFSEWQIWNDTGGANTVNEPQDAPGNFTPGNR